MNKRVLIFLAVVVVLALGYFFFGRSVEDTTEDLFYEAKRGSFRIEIATTGELEAKNSVQVKGPSRLRSARLWEVKIDKIVDEGTVVKRGEFIAQLDRSGLADRINNEQTEYEEALSEFTQTKLDTALDLREARDDLINKEFTVDEKRLILEQSKYEPPATIKQAELDLAKAQRELEQAKQNYQLKKEKAVAQMQERSAELRNEEYEYRFLTDLSDEFLILAPEPGMVIYHKDWRGRRLEEGSAISAWDPVVATLPDLTKMISRTYVNEVEIRKVQTGQTVQIGLDAYPEKKLTGNVINVANIGEQRPNSDAKVFEVTIEINEKDTTLRPSMTTSNTILIEEIPSVVYIPLECLHSQGDSINYVFMNSGTGADKREVIIGKGNNNEVIIEKGVEEGDRLYLNYPDGGSDLELIALEEDAKPEELSSSVIR